MSCVHVWQSTVLKGWPRNFANRKVLLSFRILHQGNSVSTSASRLLRCKDARTHMVLVNSTPHDHGKKKVCENIDPGAGGPCCGDAWITGIAEQVTPPTLAKHKGSLQTWTWKSWLFWCLATFYTFATSKSWEKNHSIIFRKKKNPSPGWCLHDLGYTHLFRSQGSKERSQSTSILRRKNANLPMFGAPRSVTGRRSKALTSLAAKASLVLSDVPKKKTSSSWELWFPTK